MKQVVRRYSTNDMRGFHTRMHAATADSKNNFESQTDNTDHLVYADWLQDQGKEHIAHAIRSSATSDDPGITPQVWRGPSLGNWATQQGAGKFTAIRESDAQGNPVVSLVQSSVVDPTQYFWWVSRYGSPEERDTAVKHMIREGAVHRRDQDTGDPMPVDNTGHMTGEPVSGPHQMSRASVRRYAVSFKTSVKGVLAQPPGTYGIEGDKSVNKNLLPVLSGSRLAVVLREIHSRLGATDPHIKKLVDNALGGVYRTNGGDTFTQIRDRLLQHAEHKGDERAGTLARYYNWHRVGAKLNLDHTVSRFIDSAAKQHLKERGVQYRAAHNIFGHGRGSYENPASEEARTAFMTALMNHVRAGGQGHQGVSERDLLDSMARLAGNEGGAERIKRASPKIGSVSARTPDQPAWDKTKTGVRVRPGIEPGQFARFGVRRYATQEGAKLKQFLTHTPDPEGYNPFRGVLYSSHPNGQRGGYSANDHMAAQIEHTAVKHALDALGVRVAPPGREDEAGNATRTLVDLIRGYVQKNPNDILSKFYKYTAHRLKAAGEGTGDSKEGYRLGSAPVGLLDMITAVAPLVKFFGSKMGLVKPKAVVKGLPNRPEYQGDHEGQQENVPAQPGEIDLAEPWHHADVEDVAHSILSQEAPAVPEKRPFGYGQSIPHQGQSSEGDFATGGSGTGAPPSRVAVKPSPEYPEIFDPDLPQVEGSSPILDAVERAPGRSRGLKPIDQRRAIYQTIADHTKKLEANEDEGWAKQEGLPSVLDTVMEKHGLDRKEAMKHINNFNRAKTTPPGKPPKPTQRVWPPVPRTNRLSRREVVIRYAYNKYGPPPAPEPEPDPDPEPDDDYEDPWTTAQNWHGGQWSGLYRVGTGATDRDSVEDALGETEKLRASHGHDLNLERLHEWLTGIHNDLPPVPEEEDPTQYAAYRAPAGGMVVRGTHYKGGETVPDMKGKFANPPKKVPRKAIKKQEDTPPEGFGGTGPAVTHTPVAGPGRREIRRKLKMGRGVKRYAGETTEEDFHRMLDANPDDHDTRKILADFLEERGDPRAAGYRALGTLKQRPRLTYGPALTSTENPTTLAGHEPYASEYKNHAIPHDWYQAIEAPSVDSTWWKKAKQRRVLEDAAALAFSKLPPERQHEIMNPPPDATGHMRPVPGGHDGNMPRKNIVPEQMSRRVATLSLKKNLVG